MIVLWLFVWQNNIYNWILSFQKNILQNHSAGYLYELD